MRDLRSHRLMLLKALLFVFLGTIAGGTVLLDQPNVRTAVLLVILVWAFARAYYFAFYVIEHYIDPGYRFSGLWSAARFLMSRRRP